MTREEAIKIIELYKYWNIGQKSVGHAFGGTKNTEDEIYDARRNLIKKAYEVLNAS